MDIDEKFLSNLWLNRKQRYSERDRTGARLRDVLSNRLSVHFKDLVKPGEEPVVANLVWAAARTIGQRVGRMPRIDCQPKGIQPDSERAKGRAEEHEKQLIGYIDQMGLQGTFLQSAFWLVQHDLAPLVVRPSKELGIPVIEVKDPLTCYPGTVWPHKPDTYDCLFASRVPAYQARSLYRDVDKAIAGLESRSSAVAEVTIGEYWDPDGVTVAMLEPTPRILDYIPSLVKGETLVYLARGFTPDLDFHGQFDHVVPILIAQAKLFALMMAYAEQQVFAETYVVGEINSNNGRLAFGPGAVNQITPMPGANAFKLTNNMSPQVFQEHDHLERAIRMGGGFPAQLSGEPVASIATGKGLEQLTLTVDDNVIYWQTVLTDASKKALEVVPKLAKAMNADGMKHFYDDVSTNVRFLSGSDPASTVRMLQLRGDKEISRMTVMDTLPEVDSPIKEMGRIQAEELRDALVQSILAQVGQGLVGPVEIAGIIKSINNGMSLEEAIQSIQQPAGAEGEPGEGQLPPPSLAELLKPAVSQQQPSRYPFNAGVGQLQGGGVQ